MTVTEGSKPDYGNVSQNMKNNGGQTGLNVSVFDNVNIRGIWLPEDAFLQGREANPVIKEAGLGQNSGR